MDATKKRFAGRLSGARRGVLAIASGSLIGQAILALGTPVLSRLYDPAAFGVFSAIVSIASIVGPAATLKLEWAMLLADDEDDARRLMRLSLGSVVVVSVASGLVAWLWTGLGQDAAYLTTAGGPLWVGATVLTTGAFVLFSQAALRGRNYSVVASRSVYQSAATIGGQLLLSLITRSPAGLLGGYVFGRGVGFWALFKASKDLFAAPKGRGYARVLRTFWRFPLVFTPSGLLNTLGTQLPLLIVAAWFGASSAGELGMAQRLVFIPSTLVGASMGQVFGAELSKRLRERTGGERGLYIRASLHLGYVAVPVVAVLVFVAPWFLPLLLGPSWEFSGEFAQAMALSVGLGLIASPVSIVYNLYQRSLPSLILDISRVALIAVTTGLAIALHADAIQTTWLLYGGQAINYLVTWVYGLRIVSGAEPEQTEKPEPPTAAEGPA